MSGIPSVPLPPVTVTGKKLSDGEGFSAADLLSIFNAFENAGQKDAEQRDHENPLDPNEPTQTNVTADYLLSIQAFRDLPKSLQQTILNSPKTAEALAQLFARGGKLLFENLPNGTGAQYEEGPLLRSLYKNFGTIKLKQRKLLTIRLV